MVTNSPTCEAAGYKSIYDSTMCVQSLQLLQYGDELFEIDSMSGVTKPPGCSAAIGIDGSLLARGVYKGYLNADSESERIYAPNVGTCSESTPCFCGKRTAPICARKDPLPYIVVTEGTCRSNGYEDYLDMTECTEVLAENFYGREIAFAIHDVEGTAEPPGCWPLTIEFLKLLPTSSRAIGPEACISRNQSETRTPPFGYCSTAIPCYCKPV